MTLKVRKATGEDAHYVMDIDIKCFDDPWPPEYWRFIGEELEIGVVTHYGTPIAMAVFCGAETERGIRFVSIQKIAVKEPFRRRGAGTMLVGCAENYARKIKAKHLTIVVPESSTTGDRSIAGWLAKTNFQAVAVDKDRFVSYGEVEDGYLFQMPCRANCNSPQ